MVLVEGSPGDNSDDVVVSVYDSIGVLSMEGTVQLRSSDGKKARIVNDQLRIVNDELTRIWNRGMPPSRVNQRGTLQRYWWQAKSRGSQLCQRIREERRYFGRKETLRGESSHEVGSFVR